MANFNLDITLKKAVDEFKSRSAQEMAQKSGTDFSEGKFSFVFLNSPIEVAFPEGVVLFKETEQEAGLVERILVLHYLIHSSGDFPGNRNISFKELPGGSIYIEPFSNRCIRPLVFLFGRDLPSFETAAVKCNGVKQKFGDISYCFKPFPNVLVTLVLWAGDEEFPASANILFDETAPDYLATEDYAFLCGILIDQLKKYKG